MESAGANYLSGIKKLFRYYKSLGDAVIDRISEDGLCWQYNETSNSIAVIIQHISGNSISRWSDFMHSDGEKSTRDRDAEFEQADMTKPQLKEVWEKGWECLFTAIDPLTESDLMVIVYIRNEGHTVMEAINRQLAHLPYHIGQMVFVAKMVEGDNWQSLTIPRGKSKDYNKDKFAADKKDQFFTDGMGKK